MRMGGSFEPDIGFNEYLSSGTEFVLQKVSGFSPNKEADLIGQFNENYNSTIQ